MTEPVGIVRRAAILGLANLDRLHRARRPRLRGCDRVDLALAEQCGV